ncbi:hypothetical protein AB0O28_38500 [Microbispora sp. NPDC088329]|uniref:hypothetical protein n=1 Tax=Microbispora sp. NPDC088329 TaxID=3154869 RepID=UPI0034223DFA
MRDPVTEDAYEQDGSLIRPYIAGEGQHAAEGDRFWSEEHDEQALGAAPRDHGDVLSEDWRPDQPPQTPADHADQDDYTAGRTARLRSDDLASDEGPVSEGRLASDGALMSEGGLVSDGDTDPRGFLGSGWRNTPDPEEDEDEGSRRGGLLLRTGLIAVGVLGAIWALALWVGQPSGADCAEADCAAGAKPAVTAPVSPAADGDTATGESGDAPTDVPTDVPTGPSDDVPSQAPSDAPSDAPRAEPTRTRPATSGTSAPAAPSHAPRSHAQNPGSGNDTADDAADGAASRPSRSRVSVDTPERSSGDERADGRTSGTDRAGSEEQAATAPTSEPATEQPTTAPAPAQDSSRRGGGLFGWLFG